MELSKEIYEEKLMHLEEFPVIYFLLVSFRDNV